jgi:hypothetical protein
VTVVAKALVDPLQLTTSDVTQYTAPANTRTIIDKMTATNTTGAAATITVNLVKAAGSVATTNVVISAQSIAAGTTYVCPEAVGHILNPGDFISAKAGTATALTYRVSGREVS